MLPQQPVRSIRSLGAVVALALAVAVLVPSAAMAKPAGEPFVSPSPATPVSQDLVSPDARDAGTTSGAGVVSSQSFVSPDARDAADGRVIAPAPVAAPDSSTGGVDGWNLEVVLGLAAAGLMGIAGIGLLARVRTRRPRTHTLA